MTRRNIYRDYGNFTQDGEELKVHEKGHMIKTPRFKQLFDVIRTHVIPWSLTQVKGNRFVSYVIPHKLVYSNKLPIVVAHFIWDALLFLIGNYSCIQCMLNL